MWPFSDFQYGFRSSGSTADLLTVVSDRIAGAFKRSGVTQAVALNISKDFDRVWHAGFLHKLSGQIFGLVSSFRSNIWLQVVLDGKSSQEYPVNPGVSLGSFLVLHFSYYTLKTILMMLIVLLLSMLMLLSIPRVISHLIFGNR